MAQINHKIPKAIILSGASGVGKDSFLDCLSLFFKKNSFPLLKRVSLGDICRAESDAYCREHFGISTFTKNRPKKNLIRPIIVETVKIKKKQNPNYYVNKVKPLVKDLLNNGLIPCVTDGRYIEEVSYFKKLGGILVYIQRQDELGMLIPPANSGEEKNNEILVKLADYIIVWPTLPTKKQRYEYCLPSFLSWFK